MKRLNRHFNREETDFNNYYIGDYGMKRIGSRVYSGYVKCRLVHTVYGPHGMSVIIPDLLILDGSPLRWIQPLAFKPNFLLIDEDDVRCAFFVDISCGNTLRVEFRNRNFVRKLPDGSELFRCRIDGPDDLKAYTTGIGYFNKDKSPFLELYHHTSQEAAEKILTGHWLKDGAWNISGSKRLSNISYVYFTCLDSIKREGDLREIAMASDAKSQFRTDNSSQVISIRVTRKTTAQLTEALKFTVEASAIAPNHIWRHDPSGGFVWYQVCSSFIFRIGIKAIGQGITFEDDKVIRYSTQIKHFNYVIMGDATTLSGLSAPFEEDNTKHVMKMEQVNEGSNILNFWRDNANQDHYTRKSIELPSFVKE